MDGGLLAVDGCVLGGEDLKLGGGGGVCTLIAVAVHVRGGSRR